MASKSKILHNFILRNNILMPKRFYFERTETVTKNSKGWVEIDTDFTQVYDCFSKLSVKLKSIVSVKLLFWFLSHEANKSNGITSNQHVYEKFVKYLVDEGGEKVVLRTFKAAIEELTTIGALTRVGRGHYYLNPYVFWRDDKNERIKFIMDENKEQRYLSHNPVPQKVKITSKDNFTCTNTEQ